MHSCAPLLDHPAALSTHCPLLAWTSLFSCPEMPRSAYSESGRDNVHVTGTYEMQIPVRPARSTIFLRFFVTGGLKARRLPIPAIPRSLSPRRRGAFRRYIPFPRPPITSGNKQIAAQSLTWITKAEHDGRLMDMTFSVEVAYLYWEATYLTLFCDAPTTINLFFPLFFFSDIWPF